MINENEQSNDKPDKSKFSGIIKIVAIIAGAISLCCCILLIVTVIYINSPEGSATSTARAIERESTRVEQTVIVESVETLQITNTSLPTNIPISTNTPTVTLLPIETPFPTNTPLPTNTPTIPSTPVPLESGGLGLFTSEWEQNHERTELDWGIGIGYDNAYDVLFQQEKVWIIYYTFDVPATVDDIELLSSQLIPFDNEYIETYTPDGRPETTVIVYKSDFLTTRFDADFWDYADPGVFTVQYNTYEGFGIGDMIVGLDDNP